MIVVPKMIAVLKIVVLEAVVLEIVAVDQRLAALVIAEVVLDSAKREKMLIHRLDFRFENLHLFLVFVSLMTLVLVPVVMVKYQRLVYLDSKKMLKMLHLHL